MSYPTYDYTFERYSRELSEVRTKEYPGCGSNMIYPALKCAGEAGELADKIGKHWRNQVAASRQLDATIPESRHVVVGMSARSMSPEFVVEVQKEMGDVLWYLWAMCEELGCSLEDIARMNVTKVTDRAKRGVVCSEGDNR